MTDPRALPEKVQAWLEKTGLPLELQTSASLKEAGFEVEHASVYVDPESEKGREIDVIAYVRDPFGMIKFFGVVECKASPNPWIILVNEPAPTILTYASMGVMAEETRKLLPEDFLTTRCEVGYRLKAARRGGYAIRQAFSNESDPAYAASMSVLKASASVVAAAKSATPRYCFALPILVVDAPLFECGLDSSGALKLKEVENSEFIFTAHIPQRERVAIRVVRSRAVKTFSSWLWKLSGDVKDALKPSVDSMVKARIGGGNDI